MTVLQLRIMAQNILFKQIRFQLCVAFSFATVMVLPQRRSRGPRPRAPRRSPRARTWCSGENGLDGSRSGTHTAMLAIRGRLPTSRERAQDSPARQWPRAGSRAVASHVLAILSHPDERDVAPRCHATDRGRKRAPRQIRACRSAIPESATWHRPPCRLAHSSTLAHRASSCT